MYFCPSLWSATATLSHFVLFLLFLFGLFWSSFFLSISRRVIPRALFTTLINGRKKNGRRKNKKNLAHFHLCIECLGGKCAGPRAGERKWSGARERERKEKRRSKAFKFYQIRIFIRRLLLIYNHQPAVHFSHHCHPPFFTPASSKPSQLFFSFSNSFFFVLMRVRARASSFLSCVHFLFFSKYFCATFASINIL